MSKIGINAEMPYYINTLSLHLYLKLFFIFVLTKARQEDIIFLHGKYSHPDCFSPVGESET